MDDEHDSISEALLRKEKELQHIAKLRIAQLQEQVTLKDQYVSELQQRLKRICEDFNYNFQLIEERDRELHSFEQQVSALTSACKAKDADLSDLRRALQSKDDDYKADVEYLKQQLDDAQQGLEVMKSREAQLMQQEAEAALRVETVEKTLREKDRELAKVSAMVEARMATLENERNQLSDRLAAEGEKFDRLMEIEREKLRDVIEEHKQCATILKDCERRLKDETNTLQMLNASKDGQLEDAEKRIKSLESERSDLIKETQKARKDRESELADLRSRITDEAEVARLTEQIRVLQDANLSAKSQKSTLEEVISSLERELDLERKERTKDRRSVRDAQARLESETHFAIEKNTQWQTIAESRAEEVATARVIFTLRGTWCRRKNKRGILNGSL